MHNTGGIPATQAVVDSNGSVIPGPIPFHTLPNVEEMFQFAAPTSHKAHQLPKKKRKSVAPAPEDADESKKNNSKRGWDSWTQNEKEAFFAAVKECGRDFEAVTSKIESKTYEQVRHYYYRILKKIAKILKPFKVEKRNHPQVVEILSTYWELKKNLGDKEENTASFAENFKRVLEQRNVEVGQIDILSHQPQESSQIHIVKPSQFHLQEPIAPEAPVLPPSKRQDVKPETELEKGKKTPTTFLSPEMVHHGHGKKVQTNAKLLFVPKNDTIQQLMAIGQLHPRLHMTVGGKKTVANVIDFLRRKWTYIAPGRESLECISGQNPITLVASVNGVDYIWTKENGNETFNSIFATLGIDIDHSFLQLSYSWPLPTDNDPVSVDKDIFVNTPSPTFTLGLDSPNSDLTSFGTDDLFTTPVVPETKIENVASFPPRNSLFDEDGNDGLDSESKNKDELEAKSFYKHFEPSNSMDSSAPEFLSPRRDSNHVGSFSFKNIFQK